MKYNKLTDFAIFILVAAAVFQTGKLWLGNTDSHNFFYSLYSSSAGEVSETDKNYDIIEPEKTVVGYGNRKFNMLYSDDDQSSVTELSEKVIGDVFRNGEFAEASAIDWSSYIEGKVVIMKYSFFMSSREYIKGYGLNNESFLNNVKSINYIVVVPGSGSSETTYCYFIDSTTSEAYQFNLTGAESSSELYNAIQNMQYSSGDTIDYISTVQSGLNIFDSTYVPQWSNGEYTYHALNVSNPFSGEDGSVDSDKLGDCVNKFFDNYVSGADATVVNDVYTFTNDNTVVKYYENGVLEYYDYGTGTSSTEQTLSSAYTISQNFLQKDMYITNDIYLSGAETRNDGLALYYDYAVDDVPVEFSEDLTEETGMSHAIEIVVSNDGVKRYKRYVAEFAKDDTVTAKINVDMISAWDNAIMNYKGTDVVTSVEDMAIGYYMDGESDIFIKWFTTVNGTVIVGDTYN